VRNPSALALAASLLTACGPRADAGHDQWQVGFDKPITLDGSRSRGKSFEWKQVAGPKVAIEGANEKVAHFRTRPLQDAVPLSEYPGPVAIGQQALYRFELVAHGGERSSAAQVTVTSASANPGTGGIPMDTDVYFNGGVASEWSWKLTLPEGSQAQLVDANTRTPHFRADIRGAYNVMDEKSGYNFFVWSGRYDLVPKDCGRSDCHPKEEEAWKKTKHATAARHDPACVRCHSVAFDPGAQNGGFDEACPGGKCDGDKAVLGVVYCLSCHGPGFRSAANYGEGSCAQCHDAPPKYTKVAEWRQAKMARLTPGLEPAVQVMTKGCPDCHSSQGFVRWMKGKPGRALGPTYAAPVSCPTCHDPHSSDHPHQLRVYGNVDTRSGLHLTNVGEGALCATCHNAGMPRDQAIKERRAPHAPQADMLYAEGQNPTKDAPDLCVTCHVQKDHGGGGHTFVPGGKNKQIMDEVRDNLHRNLEEARANLAARTRSFTGCGRHGAGVAVRDTMMVVIDEGGHDLGDCDQNGKIDGNEKSFLVPESLAPMAYDFLVLERDGSLGYHNASYAMHLLDRMGVKFALH
jgi:hypothetical protein